jgi:hypothetical protein
MTGSHTVQLRLKRGHTVRRLAKIGRTKGYSPFGPTGHPPVASTSRCPSVTSRPSVTGGTQMDRIFCGNTGLCGVR